MTQHSNQAARDFAVSGMTCSHCAASVHEEVSRLAGVQRADVDLAAGRLTVVGDVDDDAVRAAVAAAGYEAS
ncbi:MAG: heavy metal-associated domain-containing protein [Patulibacter sp.]